MVGIEMYNNLCQLFVLLTIYEVSNCVLRWRDREMIKKRDFCETRQFNQSITYPGCETKYMQNNFCYGQCNSKYMPRDTFGFIKCAACRPTKPKEIKIPLRCSNGFQRDARVEFFEFCQCLHRSCKTIIRKNELHARQRNMKLGDSKNQKNRRAYRRRRKCRKKTGTRKKICLHKWQKDRKRERKRKSEKSRKFGRKGIDVVPK